MTMKDPDSELPRLSASTRTTPTSPPTMEARPRIRQDAIQEIALLVAELTSDDFENGFDMIGEVRRGPGWRERDDDRYSNPITINKLRSSNLEYVRSRTSRSGTTPHSDFMLDELMTETRLGRVIGPARAPKWWPTTTTPILDVRDMDTLVEAPPGDVFAATSFAILQENGKLKIRRAEDWRRSSHNATVKAWDVPTHHNVGDFVTMARRMLPEDADIQVFGHDLLNAYRQWPVKSRPTTPPSSTHSMG